MNDENLEHHLRNLSAPELPEAWRGPILSKALREARVSSETQETWPSLFLYLRNFFRQNPVTSGALAALWMLIFVLRAGTPVDPDSKMLLAHADPQHLYNLKVISEEIRLAEFEQEQMQYRPIP